ncbi:MAG: hypothetical protein HRU19_17005 [Pseudobacteriovorax sp.]|nr:hypothetical protein [Pseudobacteriovorax sp.]
MFRRTLPAIIAVSMAIGCGLEDAEETASTNSIAADENGNFTLKMGIPTSALRLQSSGGEGIDPSSFTIPLHRVAFYESEYCDDASPLVAELDGTRQDFMDNPTIWKGNLPEGTYKCIAFEMGTIVKVTPSEDSENDVCQAGVEFDLQVCGEGGEYVTIEGEEKSCVGDETDKATLYLSTVAERITDESVYTSESYPFSKPPTAENKQTGASTLSAALVVTSETIGSFTVDASGAIAEGYGRGDGDEGDGSGSGSEQEGQNLSAFLQSGPTEEQCQKCGPGGEWENDSARCDGVTFEACGGEGSGQDGNSNSSSDELSCEMEEPLWGFE